MRASLLLIFVTALASACGGSKPGIAHRFDQKKLASVVSADREPVAQAYANHQLSKMELQHWQFERKDAELELEEAKAEKDRANLEKKLAKIRIKRGETAFMAVGAATKALDLSKHSVNAYGLKIRWLKARLQYLDKEIEAASAKVLATEAAFENAKALVAKKRGIAPKGFKPSTFADQARRMASAHQSKRQRANAAKKAAEGQRKAYQSARR